MRTAEIKRRFLAHFEANGHTVVPSAPLPAIDDPNLLFINAGMVQFVPYFLGQRPAPYRRAVSVQKCLRTPDIDEVGKTSRHGTFFQMNGNFSFGDYFKEEAIRLAWDLSTQLDRRWRVRPRSGAHLGDGLPRRRRGDRHLAAHGRAARPHRPPRQDRQLLVDGHPGPVRSVLGDLLRPRPGVRAARAAPRSTRTATWSTGTSSSCSTSMSAIRTKEDFDLAGELPAKNIDTGMGLERIASMLQGVDNMYEIDEVRPILDRAVELTGKPYGVSHSHVASESHAGRRTASGDRRPRADRRSC